MAGIFDVRDHAAIRRLLEPAGLEIEDGELLIEREILAGGKSRAFVGSRPVAAALLKRTGAVPGRYPRTTRPAASVFRRRAARHAGRLRRACANWLERAAASTGQWRAAAAELEELERSEQEKLRLLDLWTFQRKEIEGARARSRTKMRRSKTSAACCKTCSGCEEAAATRLHRGLRRPGIGPGAGARGRHAGWTSCAASTPRSKACAST